DTFFMVLEYVHGENVQQRIRRVGRIATLESIGIIRQVALGLASAHKKGIIHRDISPDNLLIVKSETGEEITKAIDFGIAPPLMEGTQQYTATNAFLGKPEYCSPEQTGILEAGKLIDHRTDIYSLAVTFYYMLAGKLPFYSPTPMGYLLKHATESPRPFESQELPHDIYPRLEPMIMKALSKNREQRQASMEQFAEELDHVQSNATTLKSSDALQTLFEKGKTYYEGQQWNDAITE